MNELTSNFYYQDVVDKDGGLIMPDEMSFFLTSKKEQKLVASQIKVSLNYLKDFTQIPLEKVELEDLPTFNLTDQEIKTFCDDDENLKFVVSVGQSINERISETMFQFFGDEVLCRTLSFYRYV